MIFRRTINTSLLALMFLLTMASTPATARVIYVDADAGGTNNGSSWADAYNFLQDALTDANSSEKPLEIRVAQGVYTPDRNSAVPEGTRNKQATFQLMNGVSLKGGYVGFSELNPDTRDFNLYETILSGDLKGDDGPDFSNSGENSAQVVTGSGTNETAVLDGFTIIGGRGRGAGMCNYSASPIVNNCTLSRNWGNAGAGMYNNNSSPTLTNCTFSGNRADFGAGIHNCTNSSPILLNCTFTGNLARVGGGGMDNFGDSGPCRPSLNNCAFTGNSAKEYGGGLRSRYSSLTLTNCTFSKNSADAFGGGMYNYLSSPNVTNCTFRCNSAGETGGGMYNEYFSSPMLSACTFSGNSAHGSVGGGGMFNGGGRYGPSNPILTNCMFNGNFTNGNGGAILNMSIEVGANNLTLTNCTFAANSAANGNALACTSPDLLYPAKIEVTNCILWDGGDEIWNNDGSTIGITYSDIQGGWPGDGNIDTDPCFVDPGRWVNGNDPNAIWIDGDYHLKSQAGRWDPTSQTWVQDDVTSPCIDAGDMSSPIGYEPFPNGGIINMGTYGGTAEASKSYFGEPVCETMVAGDINGDCRVDFKDFAIMAFHWLQDGTR
jgi:hypothetical protein